MSDRGCFEDLRKTLFYMDAQRAEHRTGRADRKRRGSKERK